MPDFGWMQYMDSQEKAALGNWAENFLIKLEDRIADARAALRSDDPTELPGALLDIKNLVNDDEQGINEDIF